MPDPLALFREAGQSVAAAVRWACILEATAPKAGNVYPGRSFDDLTFAQFVTAAEIAADVFSNDSASFGQRILDAVTQTYKITRTNVNLGILLLLGPLVAADQTRSAGEDWSAAVARILDRIEGTESRNIFQAINASAAGGLGTVDRMDVTDSQSHDDIMAAMKLAAARDRIALQYADGFQDLLQNILPTVYDSVQEFADPLRGISAAHIRLLAASPDSLIARKQGIEVARRVQSRAAAVNVHDLRACRQFDESLRSDGHPLNPGTTADLIAAALYVLLRTDE